MVCSRAFSVFLSLFRMNHIDWSITNFFGKLSTPPIEAPLSTCSRKIKIIVLPYGLPFQFIIHDSWTLGKLYGDRSEMILGTAQGTTWGSPWELHGNILEQGGKKSCSPSSPKEKNWTPHECMLSLLVGCMKTVCHHFWIGLVAGAQIVGHSTTMVHKSIPLERSLIFHFLHKMPIHMVDTPLKTLALLLPLSSPTFFWRSSTQRLLLWWIFAIL